MGIQTGAPYPRRMDVTVVVNSLGAGCLLPLPPSPYPVHTIVSIADRPVLVRSEEHCRGFPLGFNDFLGIQVGNNAIGSGYLAPSEETGL